MNMNMKTRLAVLFLSCLAWNNIYGQSSFTLQNRQISVGIDAPVFDSRGVPLAGANYLAELYGGIKPDLLVPAMTFGEPPRVIVTFLSGEFSGYFLGPSISIMSVPPNGWAWLQVRAWDARLGATYEEVATLSIGGYGESPLFYAQGGDPFDQFPVPRPLIGLQSFSLRAVVPEPSTWALLALGGLALAWASRHGRRLTTDKPMYRW